MIPGSAVPVNPAALGRHVVMMEAVLPAVSMYSEVPGAYIPLKRERSLAAAPANPFDYSATGTLLATSSEQCELHEVWGGTHL